MVAKKRPPMKLKLKKGALRKATGNDPNKDMPEKDKTIHKGDSTLMKKRKVFAQNAAKWNKTGSKKRKKSK